MKATLKTEDGENLVIDIPHAVAPMVILQKHRVYSMADQEIQDLLTEPQYWELGNEDIHQIS